MMGVCKVRTFDQIILELRAVCRHRFDSDNWHTEEIVPAMINAAARIYVAELQNESSKFQSLSCDILKNCESSSCGTERKTYKVVDMDMLERSLREHLADFRLEREQLRRENENLRNQLEQISKVNSSNTSNEVKCGFIECPHCGKLIDN